MQRDDVYLAALRTYWKRHQFAQVAADSPRSAHIGAIGRAQPKLLMVQYKGRLYSPTSHS